MREKAANNLQGQARAATSAPLQGIRLRRLIHPLLIKILSLRRSFSLHIEGVIPKEPCIFTANHQGIDDVPTLGEVMNEMMKTMHILWIGMMLSRSSLLNT